MVETIGTLASLLARGLEADVERRLRESGYEPPSASARRLLGALRGGCAARPGDLAQELDVSPQAVGQALERLESRGWVVRASPPGDRRAHTAALTPAGDRLVGAIERCERDAEVALARTVGPGRHLAARTALRELIRAAG
ncbi:MAG: MarR family transcriptional regulator [Actinomycetota bacterium]|nr:MarR family transcriptional regulator [Actinomycetota bacterium]